MSNQLDSFNVHKRLPRGYLQKSGVDCQRIPGVIHECIGFSSSSAWAYCMLYSA
jgi:hypothetical protein